MKKLIIFTLFAALAPRLVLAQQTEVQDDLPPALRWYQNCIGQLSADQLRHLTPAPSALGFPDSCAALIKSAWGQEAPFNWMCPEPDYAPWDGYQPQKQHCPTGCVATATAQIMNYYRYPIHGNGQHSINPQQLAGTEEYSVDFAEATYEWDKMLDDYSGDFTDEQAYAVAQLCYHVGVASNMGYLPDGSNTDNQYALNALVEFFGYDDTIIRNIQRDDYTDSEWMQLVYTELSQGRPILYEGLGVDLGTYGIYGHSFIIDGYNSDGLVHVNWGWNGRYNGYYDISLLNPSNLHFDAFQMMVIGIRPPSTPGGITETSAPAPCSRQYYTLDGRRANPLCPGIYISQGRKIVVGRHR